MTGDASLFAKQSPTAARVRWKYLGLPLRPPSGVADEGQQIVHLLSLKLGPSHVEFVHMGLHRRGMVPHGLRPKNWRNHRADFAQIGPDVASRVFTDRMATDAPFLCEQELSVSPVSRFVVVAGDIEVGK